MCCRIFRPGRDALPAGECLHYRIASPNLPILAFLGFDECSTVRREVKIPPRGDVLVRLDTRPIDELHLAHPHEPAGKVRPDEVDQWAPVRAAELANNSGDRLAAGHVRDGHAEWVTEQDLVVQLLRQTCDRVMSRRTPNHLRTAARTLGTPDSVTSSSSRALARHERPQGPTEGPVEVDGSQYRDRMSTAAGPGTVPRAAFILQRDGARCRGSSPARVRLR